MGSMANLPPVQEKDKQEVGFWSKLFGGGSKQPDTIPIQPSTHNATSLEVNPKPADFRRQSQVEPEELFIMNPSSKHMFGRRPGMGLSPRHGDELITLQTDDIQVLGSLQLPHKSRRSNYSEHQQNRESQHPNDFGDETPMTLNQLSRPTTSKQFLRRGGGEDDTPITNDWNERLDEAVLDEDFDFIDKTINNTIQMEMPQISGLAGLQRKKSEIPFVYNNQFKREFSKNVDELAQGSLSRSFGRHMELVSSQPVIQVQKPVSPSLLSPPVPSTAIRESSVSKEGSPVKSRFQFVTQTSDLSMEVPLEMNNFTLMLSHLLLRLLIPVSFLGGYNSEAQKLLFPEVLGTAVNLLEFVRQKYYFPQVEILPDAAFELNTNTVRLVGNIVHVNKPAQNFLLENKLIPYLVCYMSPDKNNPLWIDG